MFIALKWFGGMIPRRGRQHLPAPHATEAENCNLYSGELRPLRQPALAHQFCRPDQECWRTPIPDDPSVPPEPPPEPPACIPVTIVTQPEVVGTPSFVEGSELQLQVTVNSDATVPVQYQWLRDNEAIPGAVEALLTWTLSLDDINVSFSVLVQNPCGQVISEAYVVTTVTGIPPGNCEPYGCDAMIITAEELGINFWPAMDPTYTEAVEFDLIPGYPEMIATATLNANNGQAWNNHPFYGARTLSEPTDPDVCWANPQAILHTNGFTGARLTTSILPPAANDWLPSVNLGVTIRNASTTNCREIVRCGNRHLPKTAGESGYQPITSRVRYNNGPDGTVGENEANHLYVDWGENEGSGRDGTPRGQYIWDLGEIDLTTNVGRHIQLTVSPAQSWTWQYEYSHDGRDWWSATTSLTIILYVDGQEVLNFITTGYVAWRNSLSPTSSPADEGNDLDFDGTGKYWYFGFDAAFTYHSLSIQEGPMTLEEIQAMANAWTRNFDTYTVPDYCPPPDYCDPYACDAFYTELAVFAQEWWPFDDAPAEYTRNLLNPTRTARNTNGNSTERAMSYPYDACVGDSGVGRFISGTTGARAPDGTTDDPQTYTVDNVGTVGFFVDKIGAGDVAVFDFDWGSFSKIRITLSSGIDFTIDLPGSGADSTRATGSLYDGRYSIVSWNVNRATGQWQVRVWSDFVLTYDDTGIANTPSSEQTFNPAIRLGYSAGTGTAGVRDYIYRPQFINDGDLEALRRAWQRNFASYTLPPECST